MARPSPPGPLDAVLVLGPLGARGRRRLRGRRARPVEEAEPEPVPTSRATIVRPEPFGSREEAARWLADLRANDSAMESELDEALRILNRAVRALVTRIGYGRGEAVAEGRFGDALELPRAGARRVKRSMEAPDERFAALLGAREKALVGEELVLRARADLAAGRPREAALQARVALEALIAELPESALQEWRAPVGEAANTALHGELDAAETASIEEAVQAMEAAPFLEGALGQLCNKRLQ